MTKPVLPHPLSHDQGLHDYLHRELKTQASASALTTGHLLKLLHECQQTVNASQSNSNTVVRDALLIAQYDLLTVVSLLPRDMFSRVERPLLTNVNRHTIATYGYLAEEKFDEVETVVLHLASKPSNPNEWLDWRNRSRRLLMALRPEEDNRFKPVERIWVPDTAQALMSIFTPTPLKQLRPAIVRETNEAAKFVNEAINLITGDRLLEGHRVGELEKDWPLEKRHNLRFLIDQNTRSNNAAANLDKTIWNAAEILCPASHRDAFNQALQSVSPPSPPPRGLRFEL